MQNTGAVLVRTDLLAHLHQVGAIDLVWVGHAWHAIPMAKKPKPPTPPTEREPPRTPEGRLKLSPEDEEAVTGIIGRINQAIDDSPTDDVKFSCTTVLPLRQANAVKAHFAAHWTIEYKLGPSTPGFDGEPMSTFEPACWFELKPKPAS